MQWICMVCVRDVKGLALPLSEAKRIAEAIAKPETARPEASARDTPI